MCTVYCVVIVLCSFIYLQPTTQTSQTYCACGCWFFILFFLNIQRQIKHWYFKMLAILKMYKNIFHQLKKIINCTKYANKKNIYELLILWNKFLNYKAIFSMVIQIYANFYKSITLEILYCDICTVRIDCYCSIYCRYLCLFGGIMIFPTIGDKLY